MLTIVYVGDLWVNKVSIYTYAFYNNWTLKIKIKHRYNYRYHQYRFGINGLSVALPILDDGAWFIVLQIQIVTPPSWYKMPYQCTDGSIFGVIISCRLNVSWPIQNVIVGRAGHFRYFLIFSLIKNYYNLQLKILLN